MKNQIIHALTYLLFEMALIRDKSPSCSMILVEVINTILNFQSALTKTRTLEHKMSLLVEIYTTSAQGLDSNM